MIKMNGVYISHAGTNLQRKLGCKVYGFWASKDHHHSCILDEVAEMINVDKEELRAEAKLCGVLMEDDDDVIIASIDPEKIESFAEPYLLAMKMAGKDE